MMTICVPQIVTYSYRQIAKAQAGTAVGQHGISGPVPQQTSWTRSQRGTEECDYRLLRRDRTCASSAIGSAAPCPRQVYAFTWLPPSFAVGTPET